MFDIWTENFDVVKSVYAKNNYLIKNLNNDSNICFIFFSSNNIWFPNTEEVFLKSFIDNDYFEWENYTPKNAKKIIYLRDIYKSWYSNGINTQLNSIDKVAEFLKGETEGMEIITVGSSAGGYAAALFAGLLGAKYSLVFSAQFDLYRKGFYDVNPILQSNKLIPEKEQYYSIAKFIDKSDLRIFYFLPEFSHQDIQQWRSVDKFRNILVFHIATKRHGVPVFKCVLDLLLNYRKEDIEKLHKNFGTKIISPYALSINSVGVFVTFKFLIREFLKIIRKHF